VPDAEAVAERVPPELQFTTREARLFLDGSRIEASIFEGALQDRLAVMVPARLEKVGSTLARAAKVPVKVSVAALADPVPILTVTVKSVAAARRIDGRRRDMVRLLGCAVVRQRELSAPAGAH